MKKKDLPKFKIIWEQVFPKDADLRIQRAFKMLLSDKSTRSSKDQLATAMDKNSLKVNNKIDEKKINKITHSQRSSGSVAGISALSFTILESKKAQRN